MNTEYEIRILEVDVDKILKKLKKLDATKVGEWEQRRYVYDFIPKRENQWIRLRTNGKETTLTYKNIEKDSIDGTKELEIVVEDFDKTNEMLEVLGYKNKGYQENRRIRYMLNGVEIDIDSWPKIPTYMEIEGKNEEEVKDTLKLLDIPEEKATSLNCEDIYKTIYGIDLNMIKNLTF